MQFHWLALAVLLVAGCGTPAEPASTPTFTAPPTPVYQARIVVTQEFPDGPAVQAEVRAIPLLEGGGLGPLQVQGTDTQGAVRFTFREPTTLLVRAIGPPGWTSEGTRIHVGTQVAAEGLTVSDGDVFLPLYRANLAFSFEQAWSTVTAGIQPDGQRTPALTTHALQLPDNLQAAYLSRFSDARVRATWMDTPEGLVASLSTGLAWNGKPWVEGAESSGPATGERFAEWDGDLPTAGRPQDLAAAQLEAVLLSRSAVVGEVLVHVTVDLEFGGRFPTEIADDPCHLLC